MINNTEIHFQQSEAWQAFQEKLGRKVFVRHGNNWEYRAILEPGRFGLDRLYCPYGPTAENATALQSALESLLALAQSLKVAYIRVQPLGTKLDRQLIAKYSLHKVRYSQPAHTWCIDTRRSKVEILAEMKQNNRNLYNNFKTKGISYQKSYNPQDIGKLTKLLHEVAQHNGITVHSDRYFELQAEALLPIKSASLHLMTYEQQTIAAALVYEGELTTYYAHAAASHEYRKLGASTALLACIILDAKTLKKHTCDLYGVTESSDPNHRWAGFTKFKKSFGGFALELSETYELPVKKMQHAALRSVRQLHSDIKKLKISKKSSS